MRIKLTLSMTATLLAAVTALCAPPAPTGTGVSTNTPFTDTTTITNVAVSIPVGNFTNSVIYAPAKALKQGIQLVWNQSVGAMGYALYYGDVNANAPSRFDVAGNTSAVLFGLSTNTVFYFYVTAYDATRSESPPSSAVLVKPGS